MGAACVRVTDCCGCTVVRCGLSDGLGPVCRAFGVVCSIVCGTVLAGERVAGTPSAVLPWVATDWLTLVVGADAKNGMPAGDCATTDDTEAIGSVREKGTETVDVLAVKSEDRGSVVVVGE